MRSVQSSHTWCLVLLIFDISDSSILFPCLSKFLFLWKQALVACLVCDNAGKCGYIIVFIAQRKRTRRSVVEDRFGAPSFLCNRWDLLHERILLDRNKMVLYSTDILLDLLWFSSSSCVRSKGLYTICPISLTFHPPISVHRARLTEMSLKTSFVHENNCDWVRRG